MAGGTVSPAVTATVAMVPARGAASVWNSFMDSMTTSGWPASTTSPGATFTSATMPGMGARSVSPPAPPAPAA